MVNRFSEIFIVFYNFSFIHYLVAQVLYYYTTKWLHSLDLFISICIFTHWEFLFTKYLLILFEGCVFNYILNIFVFVIFAAYVKLFQMVGDVIFLLQLKNRKIQNVWLIQYINSRNLIILVLFFILSHGLFCFSDKILRS